MWSYYYAARVFLELFTVQCICKVIRELYSYVTQNYSNVNSQSPKSSKSELNYKIKFFNSKNDLFRNDCNNKINKSINNPIFRKVRMFL